MLLNKSKDLLFFVLLLTFLNLMGPGALLLSVPVFLYDEKLDNKLLLSGILISGFISFLFSIYFIKSSAAVTFFTMQLFVLTVPFLYILKKGIKNLFLVLVSVVFSTFLVILLYELINKTYILEDILKILIESQSEVPKEFTEPFKSISKYGVGAFSTSEGLLFLFNLYIYSKIKKVNLKFDSFKLPEFLLPVFIFIAIIFIAITFSQFKGSYLESLTFNLLISVMFFYFICGFAIVLFWLNIAKTPTLLRVFVYITCIMQPGMIMLTAIGFADFWLNIRKRLIKKYLK